MLPSQVKSLSRARRFQSSLRRMAQNERLEHFPNLEFPIIIIIRRSRLFNCRSSWQYQADRDFPAILNKVLSETEQPKIYLAGHSMGGTVSFAFLSRNHSYDDKVTPRPESHRHLRLRVARARTGSELQTLGQPEFSSTRSPIFSQ